MDLHIACTNSSNISWDNVTIVGWQTVTQGKIIDEEEAGLASSWDSTSPKFVHTCDDVMTWKRFPYYCPFVTGIQQLPALLQMGQ